MLSNFMPYNDQEGLYGDAASTIQDRVSEAPKSGDEEAKTEGKTALINSDICEGMKPGDEMVVKIERVMDGQYEVSYAPEPTQKEEGPGDEGMAEMPKGGRDQELAGMMD
jgi:hypothetical protein